MSTQSQIIENAPAAQPPRATGDFQVAERLHDCAAKLREHIRGPVVSHWLKDNHALLQSSIDVYPEHPQLRAAVGFAAAARNAVAAIHVGFDGAAVACFDSSIVRPDFQHLRAEFMSENSRITEKWLAATVGVLVGAADPYPADANESFFGA